MLFGRREEFAIEAEVEPNLSAPSQVWGRICVWCRGEMLGNFDERHCLLASAVWPLVWIRDHVDDLWDQRLNGLNEVDAFRLLDALLYGGDDRSLEEVEADSERFCKFDFLTNWGESFDHWKGFIFRPGGPDVRIACRYRDDSVKTAVVSRGIVAGAIDELKQWFVERERQLKSAELAR